MSKEILSVQDALKAVRAKTKVDKKGEEVWVYNRFNVDRFNTVMRALINDPDFTFTSTTLVSDNAVDKEIKPTEKMREFIYKILVNAGVDKSDAKSVMKSDFKIDNVDGLYEFFTVGMQLFMNEGNKFDLIPTKDMKATLALKSVAATEVTKEVKNPKDGSIIGTFKTSTKAHKILKAVSKPQKNLVKKVKIK